MIRSLAFVCAAFALAGCSGAPTAAPTPADLRPVAEKACRDELMSTLKAPSTAVVKVEKTVRVGKPADPTAGFYVASGTVDAENSYSAKLRDTWECQVVIKDGAAVAPLTALGAGKWSIDEQRAILACETRMGTAYDKPVKGFSSESVTRDDSEWRVSGLATVGDNSLPATWHCDVVFDQSAVEDDRVRVLEIGDGV